MSMTSGMDITAAIFEALLTWKYRLGLSLLPN